MNELFKKIKENQFLIASSAAIIAAIAGVFIVATLAPFRQELAIQVTKVSAIEEQHKQIGGELSNLATKEQVEELQKDVREIRSYLIK